MNTIIHRGTAFLTGEYEQLRCNRRGEMELLPGACRGCLLSPVVPLPEFRECVGSWNAFSSHGDVELQVRLLSSSGRWSGYVSFGVWTRQPAGRCGGSSREHSGIQFDIDRLIARPVAVALQYRVFLRRRNLSEPSPRLRQVAVTTVPGAPQKSPPLLAGLRLLPVPPRSQRAVPAIGRFLCSPTSLAMAMACHGVDLPTAQVAAQVFDPSSSLYGNWPFNTAAAAEFGLTAHVEYAASLRTVQDYLLAGLPVIASIRPGVLADGTRSEGHLVVVRGFHCHGNSGRLFLNDPWGQTPSEIRQCWKLERFERCWKHYIYVLAANERQGGRLRRSAD